MAEELYHHGVKGMKWGVRRARKDAASGNKQASRALELRKDARGLNKYVKTDSASYKQMRKSQQYVNEWNEYRLKNTKSFDKEYNRVFDNMFSQNVKDSHNTGIYQEKNREAMRKYLKNDDSMVTAVLYAQWLKREKNVDPIKHSQKTLEAYHDVTKSAMKKLKDDVGNYGQMKMGFGKDTLINEGYRAVGNILEGSNKAEFRIQMYYFQQMENPYFQKHYDEM